MNYTDLIKSIGFETICFDLKLEDDIINDQPDSSNEPPRFVMLTDNDLDELEMQKNEINTVRQTSWALNVFTAWLKSNDIAVDFTIINKNDMNQLLRRFYGSVRNVKGELYGISSFVGLRAGLNRYLNEPPISRGWCLMKDAEFTPANNVFVGVVKKIRKSGGDRTLHHPAISPEDLAKIYQSKALDPGTPRGLLNKVWFDIQLHFGRRGKEGNRELRRESFVMQEDENGGKFVTLSFNEETKNHKTHQERDRELRRGAMFQCAGEMCPVASFELYVSKLPVDTPAFYLQPKKSAHLSDAVWYSAMPLGVNQLSKMLPRICKEAGTSRVYTNHCLRATAIQSLSDAGMEAREIITVSGHKSETSLKSYWRPSLQSRKRWSNVLSVACNPTDDLEEPPKKTPNAQECNCTTLKQTPQLESFFKNCTMGSVQINVHNH
ncbi:uncharacterized protein KIAA1958-like [Brachyhypopomus gauderio]|uniref:uncharacterized protein KIAA1958-like n=1 Tax=Brachyhypopomus gauderio TaxID=698409 RepID=UPI00404326D4